jgi:hypothetical protein
MPLLGGAESGAGLVQLALDLPPNLLPSAAAPFCRR